MNKAIGHPLHIEFNTVISERFLVCAHWRIRAHGSKVIGHEGRPVDEMDFIEQENGLLNGSQFGPEIGIIENADFISHDLQTGDAADYRLRVKLRLYLSAQSRSSQIELRSHPPARLIPISTQ